jgi:hypothetical protein
MFVRRRPLEIRVHDLRVIRRNEVAIRVIEFSLQHEVSQKIVFEETWMVSRLCSKKICFSFNRKYNVTQISLLETSSSIFLTDQTCNRRWISSSREDWSVIGVSSVSSSVPSIPKEDIAILILGINVFKSLEFLTPKDLPILWISAFEGGIFNASLHLSSFSGVTPSIKSANQSKIIIS